VAYVIGFRGAPDLPQVKGLEAVVDEPPLFDAETVELCRWISRRYLCSLAQALRLFIPPGRSRRVAELVALKAEREEVLSVLPARAFRRREIVELLGEKGRWVPVEEVRAALGGRFSQRSLRELEKAGLLERRYVLQPPKVSQVKLRYAHLTPEGERVLAQPEIARRTPSRLRILRMLQDNGGFLPVPSLLRLTGTSQSVLRSAVDAGWVGLTQEERLRDPFSERAFPAERPHDLNPEQETAVREIAGALERGGGSVLLEGVTGSGKTEVYLHAIERALDLGRTALVLVPEIALTPQMIQRFRGRLGESVAVLHSQLSLGERYDQWRGIKNGRYRVVIGARSALFAPLPDLGLLVIDEEHENTYKEGSAPRYHAREVALEMARRRGAVLVLGSATPSLESRHSAGEGELTLLRLPRRVDDRPLPQVEVVDMRELARAGGPSILSPRLLNALGKVYQAGEQAILFLNRRGFARYLQCQRCGYIFRCRNCSVSLCYHAGDIHLLCHHCNWCLRPPFTCPECGERDHRYAGIGTERVEEELKRQLPVLRCLRMDADTTRRKDAHWNILESFRAGEAQVLLGTQMIAKGLDIPNVTLVGVINADTSLAFPDFRAGERTFQLLTQVSGRAGRGHRPGKVIVQTYNPDHYAISAALRGDQEDFYRKELDFRREAGYPPFRRLVNMIVSAPEEVHARSCVETLAETVRSFPRLARQELLGPAPSPISRLKGRYRFHLTLKTTSLDDILADLRKAVDAFEAHRIPYCRRVKTPPDSLSLIVDVDPVSLL